VRREPTIAAGYELGLAYRCADDALALARRPFAMGLVACIGVGKILAVALLAAYPAAPLGDALAPVLRAIGGDAGPHYPDAYACFPRALSVLDPILDLALGVPWIVALIAAMPDFLAGRPRSRGLRFVAGARLPAALLAALPGALMLMGVALLGQRVEAKTFGVVRLGMSTVIFFAGVAVASALAYAVPACALGRQAPLAALGRSFRLAAKFPRLTFVAVAVEALVGVIFRPAPGLLLTLFDVIDPEFVFILLGLGAFATAFVEILRALMLARLYVHVGEGDIH